MTMRFTLNDVKEYKNFNSILSSLDGLLPLDFVIAIYSHMKNNTCGFDNTWLQRALVTASEVADAHDLNNQGRGILLATTCLMEAGRGFKGASTKEASAAFAMTFINQVAPRYFDEDDIRVIYNCCRYNTERFKRGVDGAFVIMTDSVRVLTNVRFNDLDETVVKFVRDIKNTDACQVESKSIDDWQEKLAGAFANAYGHTGTEWNRVSLTALNKFEEYVSAFKRQAANKVIVKTLVGQNYPKIFCR